MKYQKEDLMYGKFTKRSYSDQKKRRHYETLYFPFEHRMEATIFNFDQDKILLRLKMINKKFHPKYQNHIIYGKLHTRRVVE